MHSSQFSSEPQAGSSISFFAAMPKLIAALTIALLAILVAPSPAHALTYYYAYEQSTPENTRLESGYRTTIDGLRHSIQAFSADGFGMVLTIDAYHPSPGYTLLVRSRTQGDTNNYSFPTPASNAHS
jgi:hypothetical protein